VIWKGDTPKGNEFQMECREKTSDENICRLVVTLDEYGLGAHTFKGVALDIGAHIGSVTVPLLIDNPDLVVLACEPVFENVMMLRRNIDLNRVGKRVTVLPVAVGQDGELPISHGYPGRHHHIGNIGEGIPQITDDVVAMSLTSIQRGIGKPISLMKLDCEGCEWQVLADKAIRYVEMIVGEFHSDSKIEGAGQIQDLLGDTHRTFFDNWTFQAVPK
jgi:FkbM family methyltransferase